MSCAERSFIATYRDKINETVTEQQRKYKIQCEIVSCKPFKL